MALMHKSVAYYEHEKEKREDKEKKREERHQRVLDKKQAKKNAPMLPDKNAQGLKAKTVFSLKGALPFKGTITPKASPKELSIYANNERLEFLGDAVLGAIVADILYRHFGKKQEGFLTTLRSKIVCRSSLNKLAIDLGLDKLIRHVGAVTTGHNSFMSGNAFEAFIGAIYIDRGYNYCYRFLEQKVFKHYIDIEQVAQVEQNHKSALIEWCQKYQYKIEFRQKESRDSENRNAPFFHSSVLIMGIPCGTGDGYSKKESDQNAARQAMTHIKQDKELLNGIKNSRRVT